MSDRGDTKLMNPEWVSRMKCEPFISKGKKTVLYISITTTEHIDGIAEEELSNLIRTEVKYNERLNEAPTVMKFVMDCLCERGLWMKDGNKLYPFAINVPIEMYLNPRLRPRLPAANARLDGSRSLVPAHLPRAHHGLRPSAGLRTLVFTCRVELQQTRL